MCLMKEEVHREEKGWRKYVWKTGRNGRMLGRRQTVIGQGKRSCVFEEGKEKLHREQGKRVGERETGDSPDHMRRRKSRRKKLYIVLRKS